MSVESGHRIVAQFCPECFIVFLRRDEQRRPVPCCGSCQYDRMIRLRGMTEAQLEWAYGTYVKWLAQQEALARSAYRMINDPVFGERDGRSAIEHVIGGEHFQPMSSEGKSADFP